MTDKKAQSPSRREFFKTASLGAAAAAAATAVPAAAPAEAAAPSGQGYRETEHVKRYYDLAKQF